jgi:hypothetical protein
MAVAPMPQDTDVAVPASRRVPAALLTLIDLWRRAYSAWRMARSREQRLRTTLSG